MILTSSGTKINTKEEELRSDIEHLLDADPTPEESAQGVETEAAEAGAAQSEAEKKKPSCLLFIGMAGTGKTTLVQRINSYLSSLKKKRYVMNLDPAVKSLPYKANIDIRQTVDYKKVREQYNLGPNGAILTSLNLFTTKFDQVLSLIESKIVEYVLIDTPGQIELFTWSASGGIIGESLGCTFPTCVLYLVDTPRNESPVTFMSNMLYACSILYKTRLPFILVFNKTDVLPHEFMLEWMNDFEAYQEALEADGGEGYMSTLMNSMCLVLEEFYQGIRVVGVSAYTGQGMEELFEAVDDARKEYYEDFYKEIQDKNKLKSAAEVNELDMKLKQTAINKS
jgi:GTPase SAR1 family protein